MNLDRILALASEAVARELETWGSRIEAERIHPLITAGYKNGLTVGYSISLKAFLDELRLSSLETLKAQSDNIANEVSKVEAAIQQRAAGTQQLSESTTNGASGPRPGDVVQ